ncbi:MAG: hypothetical protein ACFWTJ_08650 [Lachnoclostridium sp.]|jgi:hypothetical protein
MEEKFQILKVNLKHFAFPHILLCLVLAGISPMFMGTENLNPSKTARVLEMFVALLGIIMLTPVCLPEQNDEIKELVETKYISYTKVIIMRIIENLLCLMIMTGLYIVMLRYNNCSFPVFKYYLGTLAEAFFFGEMGFCAFVLFNQIAVGYLLPLMYYIIAVGSGKKLLGNFYPFSMTIGSYQEKIYLAVVGLILLFSGISYLNLSKRLRVG